jgi:hypothetical protein
MRKSEYNKRPIQLLLKGYVLLKGRLFLKPIEGMTVMNI